MELEVTWGRAIRVWWAYMWRNILAIIAAMILAGVAGGIVGFILGSAGVSLNTIGIVGVLIGTLFGLAISIVPVKMILGKDFGNFRLVLVQNEPKRWDM